MRDALIYDQSFEAGVLVRERSQEQLLNFLLSERVLVCDLDDQLAQRFYVCLPEEQAREGLHLVEEVLLERDQALAERSGIVVDKERRVPVDEGHS